MQSSETTVIAANYEGRQSPAASSAPHARCLYNGTVAPCPPSKPRTHRTRTRRPRQDADGHHPLYRPPRCRPKAAPCSGRPPSFPCPPRVHHRYISLPSDRHPPPHQNGVWLHCVLRTPVFRPRLGFLSPARVCQQRHAAHTLFSGPAESEVQKSEVRSGA